MAMQYNGGVVLGADSRVSTGQYVSNRASDKIAGLSDYVYLLRSGSAADTQAVSDYGTLRNVSIAFDFQATFFIIDLQQQSTLITSFSINNNIAYSAVRYFTEQHEMQLQRTPTVKTVANLVKAMNYNNKHLVGAMIVAGWDETQGGQVYGVPIGGTISQEQWTTDGSGSTFLWGYLESEYKEGMTLEEAENLVASALALAMSRDSSSGGVIRLVTINKDGAKRRLITPEEHPIFWDEIPEPIGMTI